MVFSKATSFPTDKVNIKNSTSPRWCSINNCNTLNTVDCNYIFKDLNLKLNASTVVTIIWQKIVPNQGRQAETHPLIPNKTLAYIPHSNLSRHNLSNDSDYCLQNSQEITHIQLGDIRIADFLTIINKRKISTLWGTGRTKSVIRRFFFEKLG